MDGSHGTSKKSENQFWYINVLLKKNLRTDFGIFQKAKNQSNNPLQICQFFFTYFMKTTKGSLILNIFKNQNWRLLKNINQIIAQHWWWLVTQLTSLEVLAQTGDRIEMLRLVKYL